VGSLRGPRIREDGGNGFDAAGVLLPRESVGEAVSEFDLWIFGYIFFGHEGDAHAPACMDAKPTSLDRRPPTISRMRHQWNCRDMLRVKHNSPHLRRAANDPSNPSFVCRIGEEDQGLNQGGSARRRAMPSSNPKEKSTRLKARFGDGFDPRSCAACRIPAPAAATL
jgi:hypothetical protein